MSDNVVLVQLAAAHSLRIGMLSAAELNITVSAFGRVLAHRCCFLQSGCCTREMSCLALLSNCW